MFFFSISTVCKNTLEPKDTNTDEQCQGEIISDSTAVYTTSGSIVCQPNGFCFPECDNCAQTLLNDLEKLDNDLGRIKTQLDNASTSATSQDRLQKLEKAISDTKVACQTVMSPCFVSFKAAKRDEKHL